MLTDKYLAEIEARVEAATGELVLSPHSWEEKAILDSHLVLEKAAHTDIPALLAKVRRQREEIAELQREIRLRREDRGEAVYCGICGRYYLLDDLHYGTLGDDAGWVCDKCIKEESDESTHTN